MKIRFLCVACALASGCVDTPVTFWVHQPESGCWERVVEERPSRYWSDTGPDIETECINANGDCVRFDGVSQDPWLGDCEACSASVADEPICEDL